MGPLYGVLQELAAAMSAAGLDARVIADPYRGAGVVVDAPTLEAGDIPGRTACGDILAANLSADVILIGAGWSPEQTVQLIDDVETAWYAVPAPWRPVRASADSTPDSPLYRITCER